MSRFINKTIRNNRNTLVIFSGLMTKVRKALYFNEKYNNITYMLLLFPLEGGYKHFITP